MWSLHPLTNFQKRLERFQKKWNHEIVNVLDNLDTTLKTLNCGCRSEQLKQFGFIQSEPMGILAINQKGPGKGSKLKPFRLYVYAEESDNVLYLITLGDKDSQTEDIKESKAFVQGLLQRAKLESGAETKEAKEGKVGHTNHDEQKLQ